MELEFKKFLFKLIYLGIAGIGSEIEGKIVLLTMLATEGSADKL